MPVIEVKNLSKNYDKLNAVSDISFSVEKDEIFGFIGPDGAGKTTIFRILATLIIPDSGTATVLDCDTIKNFKKIRSEIGYMPQRFSLYQDLSVEENLKFYATIFKTTIIENYNLIKDIYSSLEPFRKRRARDLSGGMKQKLALSCALIHKPKLLLLDEPTTGVDPVSRNEFWDMLKRLKKEGITILVSTPYMDEASLCDRVLLIQKGKSLSINTPAEIILEYEKTLFCIKSENIYELQKLLCEYEFMDSVYPFGDCLHYTDRRENADADTIKHYIAGIFNKEITISKIIPDIEDCFMELMVEKK